MAAQQQQAKDSTQNDTDSLINAGDRYLKNVSLNKILSSGLSTQHELINKLAQVAISKNLISADEKDDFSVLVDQNTALIDSIQLQTLYSAKDDVGLQSFADPDSLIVTIYEEGVPAELINSVSDNQIKNVPVLTAEDHTGPDLDLHVETFLSTLFNVAKQLNLSHKCCADVLQRKLQKTAKSIFEAWIETNHLKSGQVELPVLCHFLENTFCLYSSERAVNLQLANMDKIQNADYLKAIGKISRLCRLAVRHIKDKQQRELIEKTKSIEVFRSICSDADKAFLISEDRLRAEQHKEPLTLHKAGQLLAQRYADSVQNSTVSSSLALSSNRAKDPSDVQDHQEYFSTDPSLSPEEDNQVYFVSRGRGRPDRGQGYRPPIPRNRYPDKPSNDGQNQQRQFPNNRFPQQNSFRPQNQNSRGFPRGQFSPNNNRGGFPGRQPRFPGRFRGNQNDRGRQGPFPPALYGPQRRDNITSQQLGIPNNLCKFCLSPDHRHYDKVCPYYGRSQLMPSNCKWCLLLGKRTAHSHRSCLEQKLAQRSSRRAAPENDDEQQEDIDRFLDNIQGPPKNY